MTQRKGRTLGDLDCWTCGGPILASTGRCALDTCATNRSVNKLPRSTPADTRDSTTRR